MRTARRVACDADVDWAITDRADSADPHHLTTFLVQLAPALGTAAATILAAGRTARFVTPALRKALNRRDRGCAYPGCDRPPEWCDAHHLRHWADGGTTNLDNLALVCGFHHTRLHADNCTLIRGPDGYHTSPA